MENYSQLKQLSVFQASCLKLSLNVSEIEYHDLNVDLHGEIYPLIVLPSFRYPKMNPLNSKYLVDFWDSNNLDRSNLILILGFIRAAEPIFNYMSFTQWLSDYFVALSTGYPCPSVLTYRIARKDSELFFCDLLKSPVAGVFL